MCSSLCTTINALYQQPSMRLIIQHERTLVYSVTEYIALHRKRNLTMETIEWVSYILYYINRPAPELQNLLPKRPYCTLFMTGRQPSTKEVLLAPSFFTGPSVLHQLESVQKIAVRLISKQWTEPYESLL